MDSEITVAFITEPLPKAIIIAAEDGASAREAEKTAAEKAAEKAAKNSSAGTATLNNATPFPLTVFASLYLLA